MVTIFVAVFNKRISNSNRNFDEFNTSIEGRKTYAPVAKPKFVRDVAAKNEYPPPPAKKLKPGMYHEEKKLDPKPIHPVKVYQKKAALYGAPKDECEEPLPPKPKRVRIRKRPEQPESIYTDATSAKPIDKGKTSDVAVAKTEVKKEVKKVGSEQKPATEPAKNVELDTLTSSVLSEEIQQIMIKVWQELPDSPATDAEKVVANKFRNEAGDDLLNAMGLNVTARVLNVFNPLYAKLHFSGKPEAGRLQEFIREYKISAFKRIADSKRDTFAARFDHIADFDRLCVHNEVKCGSATVTVTPCYKYFSCPPTLKSIYADNMTDPKKQAATKSSPQKTSDTDKKEKSAETATVKTDSAKVEVTKVNTDKEKIVTKAPPNTPLNKTVTPANSLSENAVTAKEKPKVVVNADKEKNVTKTPPNTTLNKTVTTANSVAENAVAVKEKPKVVAKETAKDVLAELEKVTPKKDVAKKNNIGDVKDKKLKDIDDMMVVDEEIGEEEDDEEMTDQDILALMSGGIVLDECSGTDEEK